MIQSERDKFWPLLAATIAVDSLAELWWVMAELQRSNSLYPTCILTALTLGQISVIAVWLAFREVHDVWSYIVPIAALGIAAIVRGKLLTFTDFTLADHASRTALQMLGTLFGLWLIQRTTMWRWLSPGPAPGKWEFSMRQMLLWMTAAAFFFGLLASCTWSDGQLVPLAEAAGIFAPPATAIGVVLVGQICNSWIIRLCGYIAVGAIVATSLAYGRSNILAQLNIEFILEALIIAAWVEWGGIAPRGRAASKTNS
jgi:hypothetical protein